MEIKKSVQADLDGRRGRDFFLGVVLVLSILFVALEYDWTASDDEFDPEALENIVKELDIEALKEAVAKREENAARDSKGKSSLLRLCYFMIAQAQAA